MTRNKAPSQTPIDIQDLLARVRKADAVFDLTRGVGHEVNNMMQTIVGSLELVRKLIETGRGAETTRFIESAMVSARNAASLMDRLVVFAVRQPLEPQPLNMSEVIAGLEQILRAALPKSVKLAVALADGLWDTCCGRSEAEIAVLTLVLQARDAMPAAGTITLRTENVAIGASSVAAIPFGDYVCIAANGSYTPGKSTTLLSAEAGGSGRPEGFHAAAEMTVVDRFARNHGGGIAVVDVAGNGTSVMLYLPRHPRPSANGDTSTK